MVEVTQRDARPEDAAVVAEIYNETIATGRDTMDDVLRTEGDMRRQIEGFGKRETILLLERAGTVLGWGIIKRYSERPGYRFCCETSVYLRHGEIRRGYGSQMKAALIERCRDYGYHHLLARIWADNAASIAYNRRFGYEVVGIQREIGYKGGEWRDIALMQLVLGDVPPVIPAGFC